MYPTLQFDLGPVVTSGSYVADPVLLAHRLTLPVGYSLTHRLRNHDSKVGSDGESDGVRTRDRPVKSRVLYLTKLQTQPTDLTPLYNRDGASD